jgi:bacillithiol system protein YtxJ
MDAPFTPVTSAAELDGLLAGSGQDPVVLFKHDTTCPISAAAYRELSALPSDVALVDVDKAADLSEEIAARTGIKHESPQVIVMAGGRPVWSASHYDITEDAVEAALQQAPQ